jgi:predicted enzyme related to lactoylglutathione lyase
MDVSNGQPGPAGGLNAYLIMDTQDPSRIAPFWCALLGVQVVQDRDDGHVVSLGPSPNLAGSMVLALQKVPEAKVGKNRLHFDVYVDDLEAATARVEELGGRRWTADGAILDDGGLISRIMADPEGNEFCLVLSPSKAAKWDPAADDVVVRNEGRILEAD